MFTMMTEEEFLSSIRRMDSKLQSIRISKIEIDKKNRQISYLFICEQAIDDELKSKVAQKVLEITPSVFNSVKVQIKKIVADEGLISNEIYNFLDKNFTSLTIFLKPCDISSTVKENSVTYTLKLSADGIAYVEENQTLKKISAYLEKTFCADFFGKVVLKDKEETIDLLDSAVLEEEIERVEHRTIKINEVMPIDDISMGNIATYIEDAKDGSVCVCGKITDIQERQTKTGKPFFIIKIDDTTGSLGGVYFTRKSTYHKIKELEIGSAIIARASFSDYNGRKSLTFEKINACKFPEDFVKKGCYVKKPPKSYKIVFPKKAETIEVSSVFDIGVLPEELQSNTYVVFDLETTGLEVEHQGITEIGAVKIESGKIVEEFHTLVNPDYPILPDNVAITGITPEMVKDSPKISSVIGDFMKFIDGTILVAQNAEFDMKFAKKYAKLSGYEITNTVMDTMILCRKYLPELRKADLKTMANYFGIVFHHHRALSDAYATAEAFINLIKIKAKKEGK